MKICGDLTDKNYWSNAWKDKAGAVSNRNLAETKLLIKPLAKYLFDIGESKEKSILEVGCCPGVMLNAMMDEWPSASFNGVDLCDESIERTNQYLAKFQHQANLIADDIRAVDLDEQFDIVVSFGLIEHFEDPLEILNAHLKHLKADGFLFVTVPQYSPFIVKRVIDILDPEMWSHHNLEVMQVGKLKSLFETIGMKNLQTGVVGGPRFRTARSKRGRLAWGVQSLCKGWNLVARQFMVKPLFDWGSAVWAIGQKIG